MPTLILWGREDTLIPVAAAEVFKARIPNSTLKIYDNVGHIPQEESPKQVARDVLAWIYDIDMGP
jgi:pimeloyl-ACP methyl ester carboxylesterase